MKNTVILFKRFFKKHNIVLFTMLLIGVGLRSFQLSAKSIWYDEACTVCFIQKPWNTILDHRYLMRPVYFLTLKLWSYFFGYKEFSLRFLSVLFGTASIYMIYKLGKKLFNERAGMLSAFILVFSAYAVIRSQQMRSYSMLMFFILLAVYLYWDVINENRLNKYILYGLVLLCIFYINFFAAGIIFLFSNVFYLMQKHKTREWFLIQALILLFASPLIFPAVKYYYLEKEALGVFAAENDDAIFNIIADFSYGRRIAHGGQQCFNVEKRSMLSRGTYYVFLFVSMLGCLYFINGIRNKKKLINQSFKLIFVWFGITLLVLIFMNIIFPVHTWIKVAIVGLPPFYLMLAFFISRIKKEACLLIIILVLFFSVNSLYSYYYPGGNESWREVAEDLKNNVKNNEVIFLVPLQSLAPFWYYYKYSDEKQLRDIEDGDAGRGKLVNNKWRKEFWDGSNLISGLERGKVDILCDKIEHLKTKKNGFWLIIAPHWNKSDDLERLKKCVENNFSLEYKKKYNWEAIEVCYYK